MSDVSLPFVFLPFFYCRLLHLSSLQISVFFSGRIILDIIIILFYKKTIFFISRTAKPFLKITVETVISQLSLLRLK